MSTSTTDLAKMFGAAQKAVQSHQAALNAKDGQNGNHGDNMAHNLDVIQTALAQNGHKPPSTALMQAAQQLKQNGQGGTSQHYATGLEQAAQQLQGKPHLNQEDVLGMVQTLMQALPDQAGAAPQMPPSGGGDILGMLGNLAGAATNTPNPAANSGGDLLGGLLGALSGNPVKIKISMTPNDPNALEVGDLMNAGAAFMQAKQGGADTMSAAMQAAMSAMQGGNPMQAQTPRAASGGLVAQALLSALTGGK